MCDKREFGVALLAVFAGWSAWFVLSSPLMDYFIVYSLDIHSLDEMFEYLTTRQQCLAYLEQIVPLLTIVYVSLHSMKVLTHDFMYSYTERFSYKLSTLENRGHWVFGCSSLMVSAVMLNGMLSNLWVVTNTINI